MELICDSFYDYMTLYPERNKYDDLIYTNVVTGCTTLMVKLVHEIYPILKLQKFMIGGRTRSGKMWQAFIPK